MNNKHSDNEPYANIDIVLYGGLVSSQSDGEQHYISAGRLKQLYGISHLLETQDRLNAKISVRCFESASISDSRTVRRLPESTLVLAPRINGDYREHLKSQLKKVLQ